MVSSERMRNALLQMEIPLYIIILSFQYSVGDISVVINKDTSILEDYVMIHKPPEVLLNRKLKLEYRCTDDKIIGLEVLSNVDNLSSQKIYQKQWTCSKSDNAISTISKIVKIRMPPSIAYNYDVFNKHFKLTSHTKLRAWIVDKVWWPSCLQQSNCYTRSKVKVSHETAIPPPFSRPFYRKSKPCRTWAMDILTIASLRDIPQCPAEKEVVDMIRYPVVLGGMPYGVYRQFKPYTNPVLEQVRVSQIYSPRFTVSMWLFILEYCPATSSTCSVVQHMTKDGQFRTVLFFLTPDGKCHVQVMHADGQTSAAVTHFALPRHQWIRVVLAFNVNKWDLDVNFGPEFNETLSTSFRHEGERIVMDDTEGLIVFGGAETRHSFRGYIGQSTWYRNRVVKANKIRLPSPFHAMFELKLARREERCTHYTVWVNKRISVHRDRIEKDLLKESCQYYFVQLVHEILSRGLRPVCLAGVGRHGRHWKQVDRIVRRLVRAGGDINFHTIADKLYEKAKTLLNDGIEAMPKAYPLLKQSACYGNDDAMYMVAVILNNGIYVKADEIQSQAYLMLAALNNHRLSCMALGHKHRYGIDGVPLDSEMSYMYYKYVADTTQADKEAHKDTDVFTESIRLTDEAMLREQTDEDGDIFHWLKHQAKQGVLSAQNKVGRALFWGSQGLKRNVEAAVEYFKMSADTGDSQSQFDYGIALLRGQGTKKDIQEGLKQIGKSADQSNPYAINAIGWYAKNHERDMQKAADNFAKAYKMGNPEGAYNLGVMHLHGEIPGQEKNTDTALHYFIFSGTKGHIDGGIGIAYLMIKGTQRQQRNVDMALEWARFIAEKNPAIGHVLRKGIQAYRKDQKDVSLFYYMLAADAGLEVGSFNVAWLCEANQDGITSFIEKDCVWRQYNVSVQRELQFVDSYALIKMGDFFWYGCGGQKNETMAVKYYTEAINKGDPHALFNLGFMIEEGVRVPRSVLTSIHVPQQYQADNATLLEHLYTRCKESWNSEAYIPCSIALWKIQFLNLWNKHQLVIKISSFTGIAAMTTVSLIVIFRSHLRPPPPPETTI